MAHPAAPHIAVDNPFDDIYAIEESPTNTANPPSARVQAVGHGETAVTGVRSRRCHSIYIMMYTAFYPAHPRGSGIQHPSFLVHLVCILVGCFSVVTSTLDVYGALAFIPLALLFAAILSSCISSVWVLDHIPMPLAIASYLAVFVISMISYFLDKENQPGQRTPLIIIMSVWCALIPVVCFLAWLFWKPGMGGIRGGNQQSRQTPPSQTGIELARLRREPLQAALHPPQPLRAGLSTNRYHTELGSGPHSSVGDDGFHRVREFV